MAMQEVVRLSEGLKVLIAVFDAVADAHQAGYCRCDPSTADARCASTAELAARCEARLNLLED